MNIRALLSSAVLASVLMAIGGVASAQDCAVEVDSTDAMKFDTDAIVVDKNCKEFTVNLSHSGQLGEAVMGHNWVLSTPDNVQPIATDGMNAGLDNNYIKPGDERVIAFTEIIGGGEQTSVTFSVDQLEVGKVYNFFCSFPGHWSVMRGTLTVS